LAVFPLVLVLLSYTMVVVSMAALLTCEPAVEPGP
jgi:hypothetical protein